MAVSDRLQTTIYHNSRFSDYSQDDLEFHSSPLSNHHSSSTILGIIANITGTTDNGRHFLSSRVSG